MHTPTFSGLLFDLDGTLLDTAPDLASAANTLYRNHYKPEQAYETLRPLAGDGSLAFIELGFGKKIQNLSALRDEFVKTYLKQFGDHTQLFPGVEALLTHFVSIDYPWAIVTNKPAHLTDITLERFPILAKARVVVSGDTLAKSKPHPEPILFACEKMQLAPATCAFIGDHERDIIAGRAAGLYTVVARYGYVPSHIDPAIWQANTQIETIEEIYRFI